MSTPPAALPDFDFFEPLPVQVEVSDAPPTSDAGLLPLRQFARGWFVWGRGPFPRWWEG